MQIGIDDGIESLPILCLIRILHMDADGAGGLVHHPPAYLRNGLPLTGRGLQPDIPIRRHPLSMLYHPDTTLVPFGIKVMGQHYVHTFILQVLAAIEMHLGMNTRTPT